MRTPWRNAKGAQTSSTRAEPVFFLGNRRFGCLIRARPLLLRASKKTGPDHRAPSIDALVASYYG